MTSIAGAWRISTPAEAGSNLGQLGLDRLPGVQVTRATTALPIGPGEARTQTAPAHLVPDQEPDRGVNGAGRLPDRGLVERRFGVLEGLEPAAQLERIGLEHAIQADRVAVEIAGNLGRGPGL